MSEFTSSSEAKMKELARGVVVWDYGTHNGANLARTSINLGDNEYYPSGENTYAVNQDATMDVIVEGGRGTIMFANGQVFELGGYDRLVIPAGMPYRYTKSLGFHAFLSSSNPPWTTDQYTEVVIS